MILIFFLKKSNINNKGKKHSDNTLQPISVFLLTMETKSSREGEMYFFGCGRKWGVRGGGGCVAEENGEQRKENVEIISFLRFFLHLFIIINTVSSLFFSFA